MDKKRFRRNHLFDEATIRILLKMHLHIFWSGEAERRMIYLNSEPFTPTFRSLADCEKHLYGESASFVQAQEVHIGHHHL